jgi:hypothetical protein
MHTTNRPGKNKVRLHVVQDLSLNNQGLTYKLSRLFSECSVPMFFISRHPRARIANANTGLLLQSIAKIFNVCHCKKRTASYFPS